MQHTLVYYPSYQPQPATQRTSAAHSQPHVSQTAPNMNANAQQQQHQQHVNMQSEYYSQMEMIPSLLSGTPQMPSVSKPISKSASRAIPIINPDTGINVVDELRKESASTIVASASASVAATPVKPPQAVAPIVIVPQVPQVTQVTAPKVEQENSVEKVKLSAKVEEKVENKVVQKVDNTPVVSANSEGPSVDITPKHNNKIKKK